MTNNSNSIAAEIVKWRLITCKRKYFALLKYRNKTKKGDKQISPF